MSGMTGILAYFSFIPGLISWPSLLYSLMCVMPTPDLSTPFPAPCHRWLQLLSACLTALLIPLCFTGPAVVLPSISHDLGGTPVQLNWILNGYILAYGSVIMVAGSLTDLVGPRRVWLLGLAVFCVTTFAIAFVPTTGWINFMRLMQGVGGAAAFAAAMSSLAPLFHGVARTRAFSLLGTTFGIGLSFGPLASGWMVQVAGWQWVFLSTGVVGLLGAVMVAISVRPTASVAQGRLDWPGAFSFTGALGLFTYGILLAPEAGWADAHVVGALLASVLLAVAFVRIERRVARPMLDLSLFRSPRFVGVQVLAASPAFLFIALIALLPGRFIGIDGYSALEAGQLMIGLAAPLLVVPFLAALLTRWFRPGLLSALGLIAVAAGLIWLADVMAAGAAGLWMPMLLIGCGIGLPWGLMDAMAVSVVDARNVGMATGIFNTVRVSADGVAIAVLSALLALLIQTQLSATLPDAQSGTLNAQALVMAANRAALGQLDEAAAQLPHATAQAMPLLHDAYDTAFRHVLHALAGIAVLTALCITLLLGRRETVAARLSPPATS
ncbi:Spectinomycin tetracycline efflux pump [Achromobacter spanius]|nr:Putative multidrug resistance protein MdtD [Achromobacter spanius]SPT38569.1 Spectinomycin tetracycline efflux pump [Achromobacter denitrificans]VEE59689.1 Spectinomycin tetracycline efflux pump [Achromobacter spanius]